MSRMINGGELSDVLRVEGVNASGFGTIGKLVMKDSRLTIEAKAIYSYFCSYAGAGSTAFPKVSLILKDLQISKDRYYRHFKLLSVCNYIETTQEKSNSGKFFRNVYTLISKPCPQNKEADTPCPCFEDTENPDTENKDTNINSISFKINSIKNKQYKSVCQSNDTANIKKDGTDRTDLSSLLFLIHNKKDPKSDPKFDKVQYEFLLQQSQVEEFESLPEQAFITDALASWCAGYWDNNKPRNVIYSVLENISFFACEKAIEATLRGIHEGRIKNPVDYFRTCLYNACMEDVQNRDNAK